MRGFLIVLAACGSTAPTPTSVAPAAAPRKARAASTERIPVDPISALTQPRVEAGWLVPGPAQLVVAGTSLQANDETPLEVDVLEERGSEVRVGVRLDHVRFALWTARSRMLGVMTRTAPVAASPGEFTAQGAPYVLLSAGAHVHVLAHKPGFTQVRFIGSLEVEGWIPGDALGERGPAGHVPGARVGNNVQTVMAQQGATIRADKRFGGRALAVAHYSMFLDNEGTLEDGWHEVAYRDNDVWVRGFLSKREAPSATHPARKPEPTPPLPTNINVPADTCLFAGDEPIGLVVGDRPALVEPSERVGWFTLTVDTPWGPVPFEVSGPTENTLAKCPSPAP